MKDLRERAEQLMAHWNTQEIEDNRKNMTGDLESFAREIRNEALEDAAKHFEKVSESYTSSDIRKKKAKEKHFRQGFAAALGILHHGFGETGMARMIMVEGGFDLEDLKSADCSEYDLEGIRKDLKAIPNRKVIVERATENKE